MAEPANPTKKRSSRRRIMSSAKFIHEVYEESHKDFVVIFFRRDGQIHAELSRLRMP